MWQKIRRIGFAAKRVDEPGKLAIRQYAIRQSGTKLSLVCRGEAKPVLDQFVMEFMNTLVPDPR